MYRKRTYRSLTYGSHLTSFEVVVRETDLFVHAAKSLEKETRELILQYRGYIESYINRYPEFASTLCPWHEGGPAPIIIQDMTAAGKKAGTGPMAAVAGAIAEHVGRGLLSYTDEVFVENGGDIFLRTEGSVTVGIFAGQSPLSMRIGLKFDNSEKKPFAVCTSSGTVGHSLSMGKADAICVVSDSASLADAAATAVGNLIRSETDIRKGIDFGKNIEGVRGIVVITGDKIGGWGEIEIVPIREKKG